MQFFMKNNFFLNFSNSYHETLYNEYFLRIKLRKIAVFISIENIFIVILQIYLLVTSSSSEDEYREYIFLFSGIFALVIILVINKFYSHLLFLFLNVNFLGLIVYTIELIKYYQESWPNSQNLFVISLLFQMLFTIMISYKINWLICSLTYLLSIIYLFLRVGTIDTRPKISTIILILLLCWVLLTAISYDHERTFKQFFAEKEKNLEKASYFKFILQDAMPCPILILDYEQSKINFVNQAGVELLGLKEKNNSEYFKIFEKFLDKATIIQNRPHDISSNENNEQEIQENVQENQTPLDFIQGFQNDLNETPLKFKQIHKDNSKSSFKIINISVDPTVIKSKANEIKSDVFKESSKYYYEVKIIKIFYENSVCILINLIDNTNFFRILELLSLNQYKNQLLASVSHDLRTPLNGIDGMIELSIEKTNDVSVLSHLKKAKISCYYLRYLINDILDFSLMNFKKMRLNIEKIDFPKILEEIKSLFEFQVQAKNIELRLTCLLSNFKPIFSDSARIKQILLNLVSNSLKFTQKGFIEIILEESKELNEFIYRFSVKDTGCGIKPTDLEKLFHLFGKLDDHQALNKTGIGLGLTISKKISKLLCPLKPEGLEVFSDYGKGSMFSFYVSTLKKTKNLFELNEDCNADEEEEKITIKPFFNSEKFSSICDLERKSLMNIKKKKILVVDDDLLNLEIIKGYLKIFNYDYETAVNGLEAYKFLKESHRNRNCDVFLVIMDCNMPIMDGFKACAKIKKFLRKYNFSKIPMIAMTANVTANDKKLCNETGFDIILEKPINRHEFKEIIEKFGK